MRPRPSILFAVVALASCSEPAARLPENLDVLRERAACIERTTELAPYLTQIEALCAGTVPSAWVEAPGGPYKAATLRAFKSWNEPWRGRVLPRALDVEAGDHPFHAIVDTQRQLAEHGIDFLFVPVPDRVQVHPEELLGSAPIEGFCGVDRGTARFLVLLAEAGVECVDLFELFVRERALEPDREDVCQRNNRHWTPHGAKLAARAVAERLRAFAWYEPGPATLDRDYRVQRRRLRYEPPLDAAPGAKPETLVFESVLVKGGGELPEVARESPIVLLSDSFGASFRSAHSGFESQLYRFTGHRIDSINNVGVEGGATTVRKKLARRGDGLAGKRVVVWLVGAAALASDKPWPEVPLFPGDGGPGSGR